MRTKLISITFITASLALALPASAAETGPAGAAVIRITYDAVTGTPTCTVARPAAGSDTPVGTKVPCPPAVTPRTPGGDVNPTTGTTTGTIAGNGSAGTDRPPPPITPATNTAQIRYDSTVTIAGVLGTDKASSVFRFANTSSQAGTPRAVIVDPVTGATVGSWVGPQIPAHGSIQINYRDMAGAGLSLPARADLRVSANYMGQVQHLMALSDAGLLTNASACGPNTVVSRERLGYVPMDTSGGQSYVRIVNTGGDSVAAKLVLRDAATGAAKGTWTSPKVAGFGSASVPLAQIASEAGVNGVAAVMVDSEGLPLSLRLELSLVTITGAVADQSVVCFVPAG